MRLTDSRTGKSGSWTTIILLLGLYLISLYLFKPWHTSIIKGGGDTFGYYLYLPAVFIHNDLKTLEKTHEAIKKHSYGSEEEKNQLLVKGGVNPVENGNKLDKYTVGIALLHAPFFLIAHALALSGLGSPDGFSPVYIIMLHLGSIFYVFLGFFFLRKVLLRYYSDIATTIGLVGIALGTNLYYFTVMNGLMSHSYLLFLYCLLIYFTIKWYSSPKAAHAIAIGLSAGLITLIRPVEIISLFIPLLWGITSFADFSTRWHFLKRNWKGVLLATIAFCAMGLPQLLYWKSITGSFVYYSYSEEGFNFLDPQLFLGIFGYRNGWLAYTPIMYLAIFGILFFSRRKDFLAPTLAFLPLHLYIIYSWWCWYYINGYGSRPMVETYALLSLPFVAFIHWSAKRKASTAIVVLVVAFFSWVNIFQTYQIWKGIMWSEDGNWAFYRESLGKMQLDYNALVSYDTRTVQPDEDDLVFQKTLFSVSYPDSTNTGNLTKIGPDNRLALRMGGGNEHGPAFTTSLREAGLKPGQWIKMSATSLKGYENIDLYVTTRLVFEMSDKGEHVDWIALRLDNKPGNDRNILWSGLSNVWGKAHFWVQIPESVSEEAVLRIYPWNPSDKLMYISDLQIEAFEEK